MSIIVSCLKDAVANLHRFPEELKGSPSLQQRLPYARAWYAHRDELGRWQFGPSKFIGYFEMSAAEYLNKEPRDGRQTERQLGLWFTEIDASDPLYDELSEQLRSFLGLYGKVPSSGHRISVPTELVSALSVAAGTGAYDQSGKTPLLALLIAVAQQLSSSDRERLRATL